MRTSAIFRLLLCILLLVSVSVRADYALMMSKEYRQASAGHTGYVGQVGASGMGYYGSPLTAVGGNRVGGYSVRSYGGSSQLVAGSYSRGASRSVGSGMSSVSMPQYVGLGSAKSGIVAELGQVEYKQLSRRRSGPGSLDDFENDWYVEWEEYAFLHDLDPNDETELTKWWDSSVYSGGGLFPPPLPIGEGVMLLLVLVMLYVAVRYTRVVRGIIKR